ncbi:leucine-rich repeat-containing G-protein coupled receptor 5 [Achroia grisella]|uniref:leucine-rich repeat-containing G-protein coupled receptor 5 n=1 Tax=Achroia grisella TaxID=688607 RepID=UPI0027D2B784|nr:leucine-rich repeat-containing G-protein coupled receptor 5 [Achroia grisella]
MGARSRELILLLAVCALALGDSVNKTAAGNKKIESDDFIEQYEDYDAGQEQEVLFNEDKPCPRDCLCTVSQGYRIAKCNRLEIGTQKFGNDITDLVVENAEYPIVLTEQIFKNLGLHQVATIKIVNSTIESVDPGAFRGLEELYALTLSNNQLKRLHPNTFVENKKLLLLTLSSNPLKLPPTGSTDYFLNASTVQELILSNCNIQYISANTFQSMPGLMYLDLSKNQLSGMDADTFKKLLDLEEIDLSDNIIKSLPDYIFSENTELATLHIDRNPIDSVYGLLMSELLTLTAGQTNMKFIGPSMFNGMKYIANLNLSGNNIEKIHNQAFHKLVELNYLDLSYNNLTFISNVLIKENIELDVFKISNNPKLKQLPKDGFNCSADQFNIYAFDASNCGLEEIHNNSLMTFTALTTVNLSGNKIQSLSNKVFSFCPKLVEINLAYNMLWFLDVKIFQNNEELSKLYLQGNPLKVLSAEVFVKTPSLTLLDISNADLTTLWKEDKNLPKELLSNLNFLNISHNRISELKESEIVSFEKLRTLDVTNNPLTCSHEFENLMIWLSKHNVSPSSNKASVANLGDANDKDDDTTYSWEFLSRKTCSNANFLHAVEPLPAISDEEIWERINKDDVDDFDLKNSLGDISLAEDETKNKLSADKNIDDEDVNNNDDDDDEDDADEDDGDEDTDGDEEGDENSEEEYDDVDIKVKLFEKESTVKPTLSKAAIETTEKEKIKINIKLLENDVYDDLAPETYKQASVINDHGHYDYLWPMLISILCVLILLIVIAKVVMVLCKKRTKQMRYNSAIIAAMTQPGRTKKDCGLVYQQLSEDLTGPATPKLNRYAPLHNVTVNASNMSYESSPFHHSNIVPEAV